MKPILIALALTAAYSLPALAQDGPTLFKSKPCAACHSIDTKVVGPALKDVAAKKTPASLERKTCSPSTSRKVRKATGDRCRCRPTP
nr:hypothetical protein GCM10020185_71260 [Pseudomonas brassicacearum subsp. brassicacearum]